MGAQRGPPIPHRRPLRGSGSPGPRARPYRADLENAVWPVTSHRRSGSTLFEVHHAGCWVPKGDEETLSTAQAREELLAGNARPCDACLPQRFLTPVA
ncbi:DUF6233 domain-containing protein [Streptomyces stramineus]